MSNTKENIMFKEFLQAPTSVKLSCAFISAMFILLCIFDWRIALGILCTVLIIPALARIAIYILEKL